MLTINGRPIAFHEYRRRRHRRPERALVPLTLIKMRFRRRYLRLSSINEPKSFQERAR